VKSSVASRGKINHALRVICLIANEKIVSPFGEESLAHARA